MYSDEDYLADSQYHTDLAANSSHNQRCNENSLQASVSMSEHHSLLRNLLERFDSAIPLTAIPLTANQAHSTGTREASPVMASVFVAAQRSSLFGGIPQNLEYKLQYQLLTLDRNSH